MAHLNSIKQASEQISTFVVGTDLVKIYQNRTAHTV